MRNWLLAAGLCVISIGSAVASPALTSAATYMRTGPGTKYRVVQTIPANAEIDITNCTGAWCYGSWRNLFGYVTVGAVQYLPPPPPPPVYVAPVSPWWGPGWGYGPGFYGPGFVYGGGFYGGGFYGRGFGGRFRR